jgi:hypothetical protein
MDAEDELRIVLIGKTGPEKTQQETPFSAMKRSNRNLVGLP